MNAPLTFLVLGIIFLVLHLIFYYLYKCDVVVLPDLWNTIVLYVLLGLSLLAYIVSVLSFLNIAIRRYYFLFYLMILVFFGLYIGIPKEIGTIGIFTLHELWPLLILLFSFFLLYPLISHYKKEKLLKEYEKPTNTPERELTPQEKIEKIEFGMRGEAKHYRIYEAWKGKRDIIKKTIGGDTTTILRNSKEWKKAVKDMKRTFKKELRDIENLKN